MAEPFEFDKLLRFIVNDSKLLSTMASYVLILVVNINQNTIQSLPVGILSLTLYFLINGSFLSHVFAEKIDCLSFMFGILALIMLLGFFGWLIMIIYNLDALLFSLTLLVTTTISSLLNRRMKQRNAKN